MRRKAGTICIIIGAVLLLAALALFAYNRWDAWRAAQSVENIQNDLEEAEEDMPYYELPDDGTMPALMVDGYECIGALSIPRFGLELPVIGEWSYPALRVAPARYTGSVWTNDLVICGHNYDRHFGNLKYLDPGDSVTFTDILGNVFEYEVKEVLILQPTAVEEMITGDWDLTLFTCTLGGQTRVTVRCQLLEEESDIAPQTKL